MDFYIVIPAHNEEGFIINTLNSLVKQTFLPKKIIVVNDHSTDRTAEMVKEFSSEYPIVSLINSTSSSQNHLPGSKVINAFEIGYKTIAEPIDVICKFDADLVFPPHYLEELYKAFSKNPKLGMAGGFCQVLENNNWKTESLTNKDHIRGALKAYRKNCFDAIGGLKKSMGWDTVDELLTRYYGWEVKTIKNLHVKHLRPTGTTYSQQAKYKQGEAFYKLRYGWLITCIASLKLAILKKNLSFFLDYVNGYFKAKQKKLPFLVTEEEGNWIRKYRWNEMKKKLF